MFLSTKRLRNNLPLQVAMLGSLDISGHCLWNILVYCMMTNIITYKTMFSFGFWTIFLFLLLYYDFFCKFPHCRQWRQRRPKSSPMNRHCRQWINRQWSTLPHCRPPYPIVWMAFICHSMAKLSCLIATRF